MTKEEFDTFIEEDMIVYPDVFCRLTLADSKRLTKVFNKLVIITKNVENRKMHRFEQLLRTKPRKLLLINTDSYM